MCFSSRGWEQAKVSLNIFSSSPNDDLRPRFLFVSPSTSQPLSSLTGGKTTIKNAFLHPDRVSRAKCSPTIDNNKTVILKWELLSLVCPPEGDNIPPSGGRSAPPPQWGDALAWATSAVHPWVLTVAKGDRMQFSMKPPTSNVLCGRHVLEKMDNSTSRVAPALCNCTTWLRG